MRIKKAQSAILFFLEEKKIDLNMLKIIKYMGLKCKKIDVSNYNCCKNNLIAQIKEFRPHVIMTSANALIRLGNNDDFRKNLKALLNQNIVSMLIYSITPGRHINSIMNFLSNGFVSNVSYFDSNNYEYKVTDNEKDICKQFSGLSFGPINKDVDCKLEVNENIKKEFQILISIGRYPFFLKTKIGICDIYLLASGNILDIDEHMPKNWSLKEYFSQIVPILMFLKYTFGQMCWHTTNKIGTFIIDDPLLKESYGFLNYKKIVESMDDHNFSTTIAFIPWNYKRTRKDIAKLFNERPDRLNVAVHGCDHIKAEFGIQNYDTIDNKIKLASVRMGEHERISKVKYDKVMIFPQGVFSTTCMKVLKSNNYIAAVNSTPFSNESNFEIFKFRDFLEPAVMNYDKFALFVRRYPEDLFEFAFDLFLGKPLLIVEHHGYFKDGYKRICCFVDKINLLDEKIKWMGLGDVIRNSYLVKKGIDDRVYCKIYANENLIENRENGKRIFIISKDENGSIPIKEVLVNGSKTNYVIDDGKLMMNLTIEPETAVRIRINYNDDYPETNNTTTFNELIKICIRRYLSEFRDNYLSKNDYLLLLAHKLKNKMIK